jgi:predicted AAA+ superfamily ATPase
MTYKSRAIEPELKKALSTFPAVLVTGSRQAGKTTLLRTLLPGYNYISFDLYSDLEGVKEDARLFLAQQTPPVIFDEIQYAPEILRFIKGKIDQNRHKYGQFALTGSQIFPLMKGVSESLAGRVAIFTLYPFSWAELGIIPNPQETLEGMVRGFYPEFIATPEISPLRWFDSFLMTYIERDVRNIRASINISLFQRFLRLLAARVGGLLNLSEIAKELGISQPTIRDWIEILEATYVIYLLKPYYNNISKRYVKSSKIYFVDTGLLCFLLGLHSADELARSPFLGSVFENMVILEMVKRLSAFAQPRNLYFYRTLKGVEIDLLIESGGKIDAYEIKWKQTPDASTVSSLQTLSDHPQVQKRAVLAPIASPFPIARDILALPWNSDLFL